MKKTLSITLSVLGVALFIWGNNLSDKAALGEQKIYQAEESGGRRPTLGPIRRNVRAEEAETKQQILSEAGQKVAASQVTANWLRGVGAVLFVVGIGSLFFVRKKRA